MSLATVVRRAAVPVAPALLVAGTVAAPANAQEEGYPVCPDFNVQIAYVSGVGTTELGPDKPLPDTAILEAGSRLWTLTNVVTDKSITVRTTGASFRPVPEGSSEIRRMAGRSLQLLFEDDQPDWNYTGLYSGRIVLRQTGSHTEFITDSGTLRNLCDELSG